MTRDEGKIYSGFRDQEILLATKFDSGYKTIVLETFGLSDTQ